MHVIGLQTRSRVCWVLTSTLRHIMLAFRSRRRSRPLTRTLITEEQSDVIAGPTRCCAHQKNMFAYDIRQCCDCVPTCVVCLQIDMTMLSALTAYIYAARTFIPFDGLSIKLQVLRLRRLISNKPRVVSIIEINLHDRTRIACIACIITSLPINSLRMPANVRLRAYTIVDAQF